MMPIICNFRLQKGSESSQVIKKSTESVALRQQRTGWGGTGGIRPAISMLLAAVINYLVYEWEQLEQGLLMNKESREKNDML